MQARGRADSASDKDVKRNRFTPARLLSETKKQKTKENSGKTHIYESLRHQTSGHERHWSSDDTGGVPPRTPVLPGEAQAPELVDTLGTPCVEELEPEVQGN